MKLLLLSLITLQILYAASSAQIEEYLSVSAAEEELIMLESQFSSMQNSFSNNDNTYDMQLLSVRFKEYLQQHLSQTEMHDILENYKNVVFLQYVSASTNIPDENETKAYLFKLEEDEESQARLTLLEQINKALNKEEFMGVMFDELMKPLIQKAQGGEKVSSTRMKQNRAAYLASMQKHIRSDTLYNLKEFSIEELEALLKIVKTSAMSHEVKAVYGATAYALKEFFLSLASRYDISKHDPSKYNKTSTDTNNTDNTK